MPGADLADLVAYLPAGSVFWIDFGGPAALSVDVRAAREIIFLLRVLSYQMSDGKGQQPRPYPEPPYAHERASEANRMSKKAAAFMRRQMSASA